MTEPDQASDDNQQHVCNVGEMHVGQRLDKFLSDYLDNLSRSRLKVLIEEGMVTRIDDANSGAACIEALKSPSRKVRIGEIIKVMVPPDAPAHPEPQDIPLTIVYEDDDLMVIDKPAGLVVHPAPGNPDRTLVNAVLGHLEKSGGMTSVGGVQRPGIVHRLDKDTSGLMVVAKSDAAHWGLVEQFQARTIDRAYIAMVWGTPNPRAGEIKSLIGRDPNNRKRMAVVDRNGKYAETHYHVVQTYQESVSLVECRLKTGRTHQIRVHMTHIGHPLIGDPLYKRNRAMSKSVSIPVQNGQLLHADLLGFHHPITHEQLTFSSGNYNKINALIAFLE